MLASTDFLFIRCSIIFSFGVLYRKANVGRMFRNKFTTAIGKAIETAQIFGINSMGRKKHPTPHISESKENSLLSVMRLQ